jgi:hypothetical protein
MKTNTYTDAGRFGLVIRLLPLLAALLLPGCDRDSSFAVETEVELSLRPDGTLLERTWYRDLRSHDADTNSIHSAIEDVVGSFEPAIFTRTADKRNKAEQYILQQLLTTRGDYLDGFKEVELPNGYRSDCFEGFITNGCLIMPCFTGQMHVAHNGTIVGMQFDDDEELIPVLLWPTNQSPIWYQNTVIAVEGAPLAWVYNEYLDANRTFPWATNEPAATDSE